MNQEYSEKLDDTTPTESPRYEVDKSLIKLMTKQDTHSARALLVVILSLFVLAGMIYLLVEMVLELIGREYLLFSPQAELKSAENLPKVLDKLPVAGLIAIAVGLFLVGLWLLSKAFTSGHLAVHGQLNDRYAIVSDDAVLAACLSAKVRGFAQLPTGQVKTMVAKNQITVQVVPTSGRILDQQAIFEYAQKIVDGWKLTKKVRVKVLLSGRGVVNR